MVIISLVIVDGLTLLLKQGIKGITIKSNGEVLYIH